MKDSPQGRAPAPILSRTLALADVPPEGLDVEIIATKAECEALARLNALPAVLDLRARLRARRWRVDGLEIDGELRARVAQNCVVTLEEFESDIAEPIHMRFAPPRDVARPRHATDVETQAREALAHDALAHDALGEDPPDPLIGGEVDLGVAVSEFLTLALDPYPRKPGAEFREPAPASGADKASPFALLKGVVKQTPQE